MSGTATPPEPEDGGTPGPRRRLPPDVVVLFVAVAVLAVASVVLVLRLR